MNFVYDLSVLDYAYLAFLLPIFSILGIFSNILIIKTIKEYFKIQVRIRKKKEKMFYDIRTIAILNIAYNSLSLLSLMSECINNEESKFCSSIRMEEFVQYFTIIFVIYFRNAIRIFLSLNYLLFSLNRYILLLDESSKEKHKLKIAFLNSKKLKFFCASVSLCLSIFFFFEYSINYYFFRNQFPINISRFKALKNDLIDFLKFLNYFLNNILFLLFEIILNALLVKIMHKYVVNNEKLNKSISASKAGSERRLTVMVVVNCLFLVVFRSIDLFFIILHKIKDSFGLGEAVNTSCGLYDNDFCEVYLKYAEFCYLLSNSFNIFIYYLFNKKFKEALISIFSNKTKNN